MPAYNPQAIETRWQRFWEENKTFRTPDLSDKPKYYILDMFPYPSGEGLHVGHPEGYTATDILSRYKRMRGFNVLHPMGWDAFGLPAEQHAIKTGEHPKLNTQKNIDNFRRQIKSLGFSYDWDREVDTTDPDYVKWTQWIFLEVFDTWYDAEAKKGRPISELPIPKHVEQQGEDSIRRYRDNRRLAYQAEVPVNWCPALGTVLANEEVIDGQSERGGHPVVRMPLRQWLLRITSYADRLIGDLEKVDWSESIKQMQRNWIGRSEGAEVDFALKDGSANIRVFTTRPDTLFGATYMVLSPEHPLLERITTPVQAKAVKEYRTAAARKSDMERTELTKKKTGVFSGAYAINPVNKQEIPIWVADYVLLSYGTGAIMAVPAHDERDLEFAKAFKLPIRPVVTPPKEWLTKTRIYQIVNSMVTGKDQRYSESHLAKPITGAETLSQQEVAVVSKASRVCQKLDRDPLRVVEYLYLNNIELFDECFSDEGTAIHSGAYDGQSTAAFKKNITDWLSKEAKGEQKINYKLRDWLFSRQRYWGEPFPLLHEIDVEGKPTGVVEPLSQDDLPLCLPEVDDYRPTGSPEPPLSKAKEWLQVTRNGKSYLRETNTMPQWAGSCWYYLRYLDPKNEKAFCDPAKEKYWMPVDLYVGGAEHAVLHLLYARFWHKALFDRGHVSTPEPFQRLVNQGMILGETEYTGFTWQNNWISAEDVAFDGKAAKYKDGGNELQCVTLTEERVEKEGDHFVLKENPRIRIDARAFKMSKSRGNVISPDKVVAQYGADSLRLYEMFMGPLEATKPWSMRGVEGVFRFLNRVWRLTIDDRAEEVKTLAEVVDDEPDRETLRWLHRTIQRVTDDLENMSFNTAIAAMMEFTNYLTKLEKRPCAVLKTFMLLLAPFAPHLAEELWSTLGESRTLAYEDWPTYDPAFLKVDAIEVPVQVNGKLRGKVTVTPDLDQAALEKVALADPKVQAALEGKKIKKVIVVPGKLVNLVVG